MLKEFMRTWLNENRFGICLILQSRGVKPWIQKRPMGEANKAVVDMVDGKGKISLRACE